MTYLIELLRNIDHVSQSTPPSNLFYIYLDLCDALSQVRLTKHQQEVYYKIVNKETLHDEGENVVLLIKKILKKL